MTRPGGEAETPLIRLDNVDEDAAGRLCHARDIAVAPEHTLESVP